MFSLAQHSLRIISPKGVSSRINSVLKRGVAAGFRCAVWFALSPCCVCQYSIFAARHYMNIHCQVNTFLLLTAAVNVVKLIRAAYCS